ncbi:hypothetical protein E2542_SST24938 [Spatholobus suberectus]|nr:hypothetical protein E2542_SST24938 [Spatholobus suberectus]
MIIFVSYNNIDTFFRLRLLLLPLRPQLLLQLLSEASMTPLKAVFNHKVKFDVKIKMVHVDSCMKFQIAVLVAQTDARTHNTRSRVCFSAKSVVPNACVCHLELMATRRSARATTTGRPKGEDPNAPEC